MQSRKVGHGMSRKVYLLENGLIVKKPNYSRYNSKSRRGFGACTDKKFDELLKATEHDLKVQQVKQLLDEGRELYNSCRNNFVEYMVSLILTEQEKQYFALCIDIKIRRSSKPDAISVVGLYENAMKKEKKFLRNIGDYLLRERTSFEINDLHFRNYVNGIIVDYAAIF